MSGEGAQLTPRFDLATLTDVAAKTGEILVINVANVIRAVLANLAATAEVAAATTATGTASGKPPMERLSTVIEVLNARFGTEFDAQDLLDGVADELAADEALQQAAVVNDKVSFGHVFGPALENALIDRHAKHGDFVNQVFADEAFGRALGALMLDLMYERYRARAAAG